MKKILIIIICIFSIIYCNPVLGINGFFNKIDYVIKKQNDIQRYENRKRVEDTARAMISSYKNDKIMYQTMLKENREVALQAKIRANNTAIQYNEYILKNSFLFENNIPLDIKNNLEILE